MNKRETEKLEGFDFDPIDCWARGDVLGVLILLFLFLLYT